MRTSHPKSLILAVALLAACGEPESPASESEVHAAPEATRSWPAGCVLAVDDVPIFEEEIDRASAWIAMIEPQAAAPQLRRLALTNVVLPRVLAGLVAPEARAEARRAAEAQLALLRGVSYTGVPDKEGALGTLLSGTWQDFGIPNWGTALELSGGSWSEVVEDTGSFAVFRVLTRETAPVARAIGFRIDLFAFPYLSDETGAGLLEAAYDKHTLTIVDEAWRELVPERTQFRMGAR